jgi:hypothetical protein
VSVPTQATNQRIDYYTCTNCFPFSKDLIISQETSRSTCGKPETSPSSSLPPSYDLVHDDLRGVEVVKLTARRPVAGAEVRGRREGPQDGRRAAAAGAPGPGVVLGRARRRRRRLALRRLVVHPRRLRAVRVEPRRDAHAHVQHLHVPRHPGYDGRRSLLCRAPPARRRRE